MKDKAVRTKKDSSSAGPKSSNAQPQPQPTKLTSRSRAETAGEKVDDLKPDCHIPRDIFLPKNLCHPEVDTGDRFQQTATKVGLGPVIFNLKPHHYYSSTSKKPNVCLDYYRNKYPEVAAKFNTGKPAEKEQRKGNKKVDDETEITSRLCVGLKTLKICEDEEEKENREKAKAKVKTGEHLMQKAFRKVIALRKQYEAGQAISVLIDDSTVKEFKKPGSEVRKAGLRNWKSPTGSVDILDGPLRNLFSWSLSTSTKWTEVEKQLDLWKEIAKDPHAAKEVSIEEIAGHLGVTEEEVRRLEFHKDLGKVLEVLKGHVCHTSLPWLSALAAVSELQKGNLVAATKNSAESQGTFLHGEIIDKHVCYISRNEDFHPVANQRSSFSTKAELFRKQIQDTISFGKESEENENAFSDIVSSFDPDWNIIQITALLHSKNRFGTELLGKRRIPQLLLSALAHVSSDGERSIFTTFCQDPPIQEGSLMSLGLMEEFQRILDRNLVISDDSVVISRRNYWEERSKHNEAMKGVIAAMEEEWIGPFSFLLPGHTTNKDLQNKIRSKIITPLARKYQLSSAQKLVLYKLTENYKYLQSTISAALKTVVAFILQVPEAGLSTICKKMRDIGDEVPIDKRHPTILIVDQDLEIYPWESMNCLVNTDVTLRPSYPNMVDSNSCTFVLNPDGTLPNVQKRLEQYFLDHKQWIPVIGRPPLTKEVQECLENQHVFLYNGHGAGSNFYPDYAVQKLVCRAVPLLMGCASAQAHYAVPRVYGSSTIHSYFLAGCPSVVGYLWEVTDAECDRVTVDLIERWLPDKNVRPPKIIFFDQDAVREKEKCLPTAMRISRKAATQFLTECAIVCYGLPINTQD